MTLCECICPPRALGRRTVCNSCGGRVQAFLLRYVTTSRHMSLPQNYPFRVDLAHLIILSFGRHESTTQTGSRSVQPFLHNSSVCPTHSQSAMCSNRPHLCTACRRCDLKYVTNLKATLARLTGEQTCYAASIGG